MTGTEFGYKLISEEHGPNDLVEYARLAEESDFEFAMISDHYHPWIERQGESPFVWATIGGIAEATDELRLGTGVTCPTIRVHPAIVAQATATAASMLEGRFFFGVGTGEQLSEHVLGDRWPEHEVRLEMLEEALGVIRDLWEGENYSHHGKHYTVENAKLYTLPEELPPIHIAADGPRAAESAAEHGDGFIGVEPDPELIGTYEDAGGDGPKYGEVTVCYAESEEEAVETAYEWWPQEGLSGELLWILPTPAHFEQATEMVSEEEIGELVPCGPDPEEHVEAIQELIDAGYDHVCVHQVGPDQEGFFEFYDEEVLPALG
jgi:G6PDH family F420-dependent oxidoreductase